MRACVRAFVVLDVGYKKSLRQGQRYETAMPTQNQTQTVATENEEETETRDGLRMEDAVLFPLLSPFSKTL